MEKIKFFKLTTLSFYLLSIIYATSTMAKITDKIQTKHKQSPISTFKLKNGLECIVYEKHSTAKAAVYLGYRVGSYVEQKGEKGMAHLFEHMMFRGSKNVGDEEHSQLIQAVGGYSNAYTADDRTVYVQTIPASEIELVFRLEADRMQYLQIDQQRLDKEREVVKEEYHWRVQNNPDGEMYYKAQQKLYPNHPFMYGPIGKLEDINHFTVAQCEAFYKKHYAPNKAVLVVVGDVSPDTVKQLAKKYFTAIPSRPKMPDINLDLAPRQTQELTTFKDQSSLPTPVTIWTFYTPEARHPDAIPLKLLYSILDYDKGARFHRKIVKENELAFNFVSYPDFSLGTGTLSFMAYHQPEAESKIRDIIFKEIQDIQQKGATDQELQKAKNQALARRYFDSYTAEKIASQLLHAALIENGYQSYEHYIEEVKNVSHDDIIRVARKYLRPGNATELLFYPKKEDIKETNG
ncbi:MAG: pitrilysin family protein [bacterium]